MVQKPHYSKMNQYKGELSRKSPRKKGDENIFFFLKGQAPCWKESLLGESILTITSSSGPESSLDS